MEVIRIINENMDPFLMQLVIVPLVSISLGVFLAIKIRRVIIAPIITFILSLCYTNIFLNIGNISSWEIILPITSLLIILIYKDIKIINKESNL